MNNTISSVSESHTVGAVAVSLCSRQERTEIMQQVSSGEGLCRFVEHLPASRMREAREIIARCREQLVEVLPFGARRYPAALAAIPVPPPVLFIRSSQHEASFPDLMLAIVGTRAASVHTCATTSAMSTHLVNAGCCVVSGLALGIDGAAHRGALAAPSECPTIAVVAHGLDRVYPSSHLSLADSIVRSGGMIVSEYPPGTEPFKHHFLERNRIIAGLSRGVLVVQAGERSGSLVTARFAADYGRDVFILEGSEGDPNFSGGARLIDEGAIPVAGVREIIEEYRLRVNSEAHNADGWAIVPISEFLERTKLSAAEVLRLEMEGRVLRLPGNRLSVQIA